MPDSSCIMHADAILDINATRAMYMRRLRTLTDQLLASGKVTKVRRPRWEEGCSWMDPREARNPRYDNNMQGMFPSGNFQGEVHSSPLPSY